MKTIDAILKKLEMFVANGEHEPLETHLVEIKSTPPNRDGWNQIKKSVNAFLNTRGGIVILGVAERVHPNLTGQKIYVFTGYSEDAEAPLKEIPKAFTNKDGIKLDLSNNFPSPEVRNFNGGRVCLLYVTELAADEKYCFFNSESFKRILTGDHKHAPDELSAQEEYKQEAYLHRELLPVPGTTIDDIDLEKLNEYIQLLNQQVKITTLKPDIASALPFLQSQQMIKDGVLTLLGVLVCGKSPGSKIGSRCRVQAYLDIEGAIAGDKLVMDDNVVPLMEAAYGFVLRNTRRALISEKGGTAVPEYPEALVRECVNNAFAHRDYSIDHYVSLIIKPDEYIEIRNPGNFRPHLLISKSNDTIPIFRIIPEAKARNPKLAHILNVFNKWEGRGLGMSTLTNMALEDKTDIPYVRFRTEEVSLFLQPGQLLDKRMERRFLAFNRYLRDKMGGNELTLPQKRILAYLIKSEELNRRFDFTILLTPDNDHFNEIHLLRQFGMLFKHADSSDLHPVFIVDRALMTTDFHSVLRAALGFAFDALDALAKRVLSVIYRYNEFSLDPYPSARVVALTLWEEGEGGSGDIRAFDSFNRQVRLKVTQLEKSDLLLRPGKTSRYRVKLAQGGEGGKLQQTFS